MKTSENQGGEGSTKSLNESFPQQNWPLRSGKRKKEQQIKQKSNQHF